MSEFSSKKLLHEYGLSITNEFVVKNADQAVEAAKSLRYPVVAKLSSAKIQHKTELNGVRLGIQNSKELEVAIRDLETIGSDVNEFLISEQIQGKREFIAGYHIDDAFGPVLMFGLGGIFTEILSDVNFRLVPCERREIENMINELKASLLLGPFRGEGEVSMQHMIDALVSIADCGLANPEIVSIDVNPIIISNNKPIAVDALVMKS
tara:strand:+ start:95 stop:718 length:624 start_codon:yes stop_codon:yes gene_type:complete